MMTVKIVSVTEGVYCNSTHMSGSTVNVTLQRGEEFVSCEGILIWEDSMADEDTFNEWRDCAAAGEEGYTAMLVRGDTTVLL
jgi:hypothetical protein